MQSAFVGYHNAVLLNVLCNIIICIVYK